MSMDDVYTRVAQALALELSPEAKADCDRILDEDAGSHERWTIYQCAFTHAENREKATDEH